MIRHIWTVFCEKTAIDQESNAVSLFGVIEELHAELAEGTEFPLVAPLPAAVVSFWSREDLAVGTEAKQRLRFLSPEGEELGSFLADIDLESATRSRTVVRFNALRLAGPGWHEWEVSWRVSEEEPWAVVARVPLAFEIDKYRPVSAPPDET